MADRMEGMDEKREPQNALEMGLELGLIRYVTDFSPEDVRKALRGMQDGEGPPGDPILRALDNARQDEE